MTKSFMDSLSWEEAIEKKTQVTYLSTGLSQRHVLDEFTTVRKSNPNSERDAFQIMHAPNPPPRDKACTCMYMEVHTLLLEVLY